VVVEMLMINLSDGHLSQIATKKKRKERIFIDENLTFSASQTICCNM